MTRKPLASRSTRRAQCRLALIAFALLYAAPSDAKPEYSQEGAVACIDCHETTRVLGILETVHAEATDARTPAAQRQCQSCHGPSAEHMQFPMQVANLRFGKRSETSAEIQNQMCLECHHDGARAAWKASAHGFEQVVCSTCHSMHDPSKIVPAKATVSSGCTDSCHLDLVKDAKAADFSHSLGRDLGGKGELTCAGCHNPHGPLSSARCTECHAQTPEILAKQSEKARRFHDVATRKGTECMRCHKGIAHPIPPLVLQQSHEAMERLTED